MNPSRRKQLLENIRKKAGKAIHQYRLIEDGDKIIVGVSGGIDSLSLLDILANRKKSLPFDFELHAIHVIIEDSPLTSDSEYISSFCSERGVELFIEKIIADFKGRKDKSPCFVCAWHRRKSVFRKAVDERYNKVVFGHHLDDALETLLMNMTYHGEYSSLPPKLFMEKGGFDIIRPLIMIGKKEIEKYAFIQGIESAEGSCPFEEDNKREEFRLILKELTDKHKLARSNLFKAMSNINLSYLPPPERE